MATFKLKFHPSSVYGEPGTLYYQVTQSRCTKSLPTPYHIYPDEWDSTDHLLKFGRDAARHAIIYDLMRAVKSDMERWTRIDRKLSEANRIVSAAMIVSEFKRYFQQYSLFQYMERLISQFKRIGKQRTAETYAATLHSIKRYREGQDLMLDSINATILEGYEGWMRVQGLTPNTTSFYMRILRAVYNRAVENEIIDDHHPFRRVYTGVEKTQKRAIPLKNIKLIRQLDLSASPGLDYARDMFMLSFYFRGMSFIDMAFLKKSDLRNGYLSYRRRKTGQLLSIEWTAEMQAILDKYPENPTQYLLPVIIAPGLNERCAYRNKSYSINRKLKVIGELLHFRVPLTLYVARHSWASAALAHGIPVSIISEGMGHDSESTTKIYLASIDTTAVDRANALILSFL